MQVLLNETHMSVWNSNIGIKNTENYTDCTCDAVTDSSLFHLLRCSYRNTHGADTDVLKMNEACS